MPNCQFTTKYINYDLHKAVDFNCPEEPLASGRCIFHDKDYLQDKTSYEEHERKVLERFKHKANYAISDNEPLLCIGFQLPDFSLSDLSISKEFTKPVYFNDSQFIGKANFNEANFQGKADFYSVNFQGRVNFHCAEFHAVTKFDQAEFQRADYYQTIFKKTVDFTRARFYGEVDFIESEFADETIFQYIVFYRGDKTFFDVTDLSKASFLNTDLTGVRFSDKARWGGGEKAKEDRFKIVDERLLEEKIKEKDGHTTKDFNLGSIKAVYRNLRENYEYRMRYDEAGQFFIREMELKRKYREVSSSKEQDSSLKIKQNNWFRRNLFSLTGWYYHLSRYGESLWRPSLAGIVIVFLSTLFWLMQSDPTVEPSLPIFQTDDATSNVTSKFVGFDKFGEGTHWLKASERSIADFIPLLPLGSNIQVGIIDYVIKIVGGAVTFGLIAIALRRRFERRYRH